MAAPSRPRQPGTSRGTGNRSRIGLLLVIGGPVLYGLSHLVFILGMYLAGAKYTKIFLRWATRVAVERWLRKAS